jgi:hypothetical protein
MIRRILETTVYHPEGEEAPKKRTKETIYGTMNVKRTVSMTTHSSRAFAASPRPREKRYSDSFATRPRPVVEDAADEKSEKS